MKKLFTIALIALSCSVLPSCGDDDEDKRTQDPTPAPALDGTWNFYYSSSTSYDVNGNQIGQTKIETLSTANRIQQTFTAPSAYFEKRDNATSSSGTYSRNGNKLTIAINGTPLVYKSGTYDIDSLTTSRLVVRDTISGAGGGKTIQILKSVR